MMRAAWRQLTHGLRALLQPGRVDAEVDEELAHFLDEAASANEARGMSLAEARRVARVQMGGPTQLREQVRGSGWENTVRSAAADVRLGVRQLRRSPVFAVSAVLTLGLGIGGATAIFSAVRPVLLEPLPYPDAGRVRTIQEQNPDGSRLDGTYGMYRVFAERVHSFAAVAVLRAWQPTVTGGGVPERLQGQRVSAGYFDVLGVQPALGRAFDSAEDRPGGDLVVVLSDDLWRRRFAADAAITGRTVRLDDIEHTVIGVMPAGFENVLSPGTDVWAPLQYDLAEGRAWGHHLRTIGRLRAGTPADAAERELNAIGAAFVAAERPPTYSDGIMWTAPSLRDDVTRGARPGLLAMAGAMALLLVMACVSVANLLLARGAKRRTEFALRATLGAGRARLIRQLVAETAVLTTVAGALGLAVAWATVRAFVALAPEDLPRAHTISVDGQALLFAGALSAIVALVTAVAPTVRGGVHVFGNLRPGMRQTESRNHMRVRNGLVVAQIAIALLLLCGSGLLLRSQQRLLAVPPGFDGANVLTLQLQTTGERYRDDAAALRFYEEVVRTVADLPGVTAVAFTSQLPLSGDYDTWGVHFAANAVQGVDEERSAFRYGVSPGYSETMGIPLRSGRVLSVDDRAGTPPAALINESLARRRFPDGNALGQRFRVGALDSEPFTIVGVVGDVTHESLALGASDAVYISMAQWRFTDRAVTLVVRSDGDMASLLSTLREAIRSIDPDQPIARVARLEALLAASAAERRFALTIFQVFALAALLLAATGLYGVISGNVADRSRELGVRAALGATRNALVTMVLRQGLVLALLGTAAGLAAALVASRAIEALLFGVSRLDPPTYGVVLAAIVGVALLACGVPAWRAGRADPANALRAE